MKDRRSFTLIELLVVVAIISILMALLLPSLSSARDMAKKTKCAGNLKSIGTCVQSYAVDNNDWIPASYTGGWLWFQMFPVDYSGMSRSRTSVRPDWMTVCPSYKAMKHNGNYGTSENWFQNTTLGKAWRRYNEIIVPSRTLFACDVYYEGTNANANEQFYTGRAWTNRHFRHAGSLNCLMADGHTESTRNLLPIVSDVIWNGKY